MYQRIIQKNIQADFFKGKVIVVVGARQVGKTTLVNQVLQSFAGQYQVKKFNADDPFERDLLAGKNLEVLKQIIGTASIVFIDEVQKIPHAGNMLKLLVDHYQTGKQVIVTGSSSINLLGETSEPLTGRKFTYTLFPVSLGELALELDELTLRKTLESNLVFGMYPEVLNQASYENKTRVLQELAASYLYKDIFDYQRIKNPTVLTTLLRALALQVGSEVSYAQLAKLVGIDTKTVTAYIDLLEKSFVVFRLTPYFSRKTREIAKNKKIYFYDTGVRNMLLENFNLPELRTDTGVLWENFVLAERLKYRHYHQVYASQYFWRTYDGSEIDLVEERGGKLFGYEVKWGNRKARTPKKWQQYGNSSYELITKENLFGFVV